MRLESENSLVFCASFPVKYVRRSWCGTRPIFTSYAADSVVFFHLLIYEIISILFLANLYGSSVFFFYFYNPLRVSYVSFQYVYNRLRRSSLLNHYLYHTLDVYPCKRRKFNFSTATYRVFDYFYTLYSFSNFLTNQLMNIFAIVIHSEYLLPYSVSVSVSVCELTVFQCRIISTVCFAYNERRSDDNTLSCLHIYWNS